jgi:hypothetical protein
MSSGIAGDDPNRNSLMRTNSNFDTHIGMQQREKYFDRLGLDASMAGSQAELSTPKL